MNENLDIIDEQISVFLATAYGRADQYSDPATGESLTAKRSSDTASISGNVAVDDCAELIVLDDFR